MNTPNLAFEYSVGVLSLSLLFFFGYWATFRTNLVTNFYLKIHQKRYLNSLKKSFFLSRYYKALTKYQYEYAKKRSESKRAYYDMKIAGVTCIFIALLLLLSIIHAIFKINFGLFTN
jgi:hypothetical protein